MSFNEIADLLARARMQRAALNATRAEMFRSAVELGLLTQEEAIRDKMNVENFLDGYLVGSGVVVGWRRQAADQQAAVQ